MGGTRTVCHSAFSLGLCCCLLSALQTSWGATSASVPMTHWSGHVETQPGPAAFSVVAELPAEQHRTAQILGDGPGDGMHMNGLFENGREIESIAGRELFWSRDVRVNGLDYSSPRLCLRGGADEDEDEDDEEEEDLEEGAEEGEEGEEVDEDELNAGPLPDKEQIIQELLKKENLPSFVKERHEVNYVLRVMNTNLNGNENCMYAITKVKGIGPRFADIVIKKAGIDRKKRAGELTPEEVERIVQIIENPSNYDIPSWLFNRRKDYKTGKDLHLTVNKLDFALRTDMERIRKIRLHRGIRHMLGFKVRGQHTKTTGRKGKIMGVQGKKR